jgi:hypothetical protein
MVTAGRVSEVTVLSAQVYDNNQHGSFHRDLMT